MTETKPPTDTRPQVREGLLLPIAIPVVALVAIALVLFGFSRVLLSLSHHAATAVALVVAISIMVVATIVATRERQSNGTLFSMIGAVAGVAMLAGGIAIVAIGNGEKHVEPAQTVTLAAPKGAAANGYAQTTLTFEAGKPTNLEFDNQDSGVQHNVVIFSQDPAKDSQAAPIFTGDVITGPLKTTYHVPALQAGTYYFHCEVHPTVMTGTITVGAGGGEGLTVTASGLAFDTKELDLTAGQPTKITFDNKDAGTLHNIAIYTDSSASKSLFVGDQIAGVSSATYTVPALQPGTYYFHCDVHPSLMFGTVVVSAGGGASSGSSGAATPSAPASSASP